MYPTRHLAPDALDMDMSNARFDGDRPASEAPEIVPEGCFCPCCGENRMDWLAWNKTCTVVTCTACGVDYDPNEV